MATLRGILTLSLAAERGPWLYQIAYAKGKASFVTDTTDALFNGLRASPWPGSADLAEHLDLRQAPYHLYTAAVRFDEDPWLIQTEFAVRNFHKSYFRDSYAGYITTGYRHGPWMPYLTLARRKTFGPDSDNRAGPLATQVQALLAATRYDQSSLTLGLSRELGRNAVLKGQILWLKADSGSYGNSLFNASANFNLADPPLDRLISLNLNFVF